MKQTIFLATLAFVVLFAIGCSPKEQTADPFDDVEPTNVTDNTSGIHGPVPVQPFVANITPIMPVNVTKSNSTTNNTVNATNTTKYWMPITSRTGGGGGGSSRRRSTGGGGSNPVVLPPSNGTNATIPGNETNATEPEPVETAFLEVYGTFPHDQNYVFNCTNNLTGNVLYDWNFNDPTTTFNYTDSTHQTRWWTYGTEGDFQPSCTAKNETVNATGILNITVSTNALGVPGDYPYTSYIDTIDSTDGNLIVACVSVGYVADDFLWNLYNGTDGFESEANVPEASFVLAPGNWSVSCGSSSASIYDSREFWDRGSVACGATKCVETQTAEIIEVS